jgi:histidinol dehydrogenase
MIRIARTYKEALAKQQESIAPFDEEQVRLTLKEMQSDIKNNGDDAILNYLEKWDKINKSSFSLKVTPSEIKNAYTLIAPQELQALKNAKANIEEYHRHQCPNSWSVTKDSGIIMGQKFSPISTVALYVPGGRAVYPSTVLMNAIPAKLAGVPNAVIITPPNSKGEVSPYILVAADICGIDSIYKVGGAQSIFGVTYGTQTLPKVDKIVGPGNIYVTIAKQMVYGQVDIDKPAGPSEVLVYLDSPKYAAYAAAELLAQLEHDPMARAFAISENQAALDAVAGQVASLFTQCNRQEIITQSLKNSALILAHSREDAIQQINTIASEHLVLLVDDYTPILDNITNAGSIFCGPYSPVAIGDYYAGPNHVLPTESAARFASPLGVMDFMKYSAFVHYPKQALVEASKDMKHLTDIEGFDAHYLSVAVRIDE